MDYYVQFSDTQDSGWGDVQSAGWYGTGLGNLTDTQVGSFILRGPVGYFVPLLQYYRFCYYNDSDDAYSVSGWSANHLIQSE